MARAYSNRFRITVTAVDSWTPPYSLPGPLETLDVATNAAEDVMPSAFAAFYWRRSAYGSFGGGTFVEAYSDGGAFVLANTGGHGHPPNPGALIIDFADATFKRLDPFNNSSWPHRITDYQVEDTSGNTWWEINGSNGVPAPPHPYNMLVPLPVEFGGAAAKGSVLYAERVAVTALAQHSRTAHALDLATGIWSRYSTNTALRSSTDCNALLDVARERVWICVNQIHSNNNLMYLDLSAANRGLYVITTPNWSPAAPTAASSGGLYFMHDGLIIWHPGASGSANRLFGYDPDDNAGGVFEFTISGTMPAEPTINTWTYFPPTGKFYKLPRAGGTTIYTLTPPVGDLKAGTWTVGTITVSPTLPAAADSDFGTITNPYSNRFFYVPAIQMLAWIPGGPKTSGTGGIYLINPRLS
jgi:hypothetical protein